MSDWIKVSHVFISSKVTEQRLTSKRENFYIQYSCLSWLSEIDKIPEQLQVSYVFVYCLLTYSTSNKC